MSSILAYDRAGSVRTFDADGRLRIETTPISKANICAYKGNEIPNSAALGLDPEREYRLLRDPAELEKGADTFNSIPVLDDHTPTRAADHPRHLTVGSTMDNASFEAPYLTVGMVIFDGPMIERIKSGEQRELSCGYHYTADMTPGTYQGQPYDGRMTNIIGNHVALVAKGRAGSDVMVHDSAKGNNTVADPTDKTACDEDGLENAINALRPFMNDLSDDAIRAKVADLIAQGDNQTNKPGGQDGDDPATDPNAAPPAASEAEDDETAQQDDRLSKMEDFMRQEGFTPAQASKCREMCAEMLKGGTEGEDEDPDTADNEDDREDKKQAMDAAISRALAAERSRNRSTEAARTMVRPLVGDVIGMDSAAQIYRYALNQSGMAMDSLKGVNAAGLRALVQSRLHASRPAYAPQMAQDSAHSNALSELGVTKLPRVLS